MKSRDSWFAEAPSEESHQINPEHLIRVLSRLHTISDAKLNEAHAAKIRSMSQDQLRDLQEELKTVDGELLKKSIETKIID